MERRNISESPILQKYNLFSQYISCFNRIEETSAEKEKRLSNWDSFLVTDEQRDQQKRTEQENSLKGSPKTADNSIPEKPDTNIADMSREDTNDE